MFTASTERNATGGKEENATVGKKEKSRNQEIEKGESQTDGRSLCVPGAESRGSVFSTQRFLRSCVALSRRDYSSIPSQKGGHDTRNLSMVGHT